MLSRSGLSHTLSRRRGRRGGRRANDLLAAAGAVFDSSLDHRETMRTIARTAVPRLADLCVIDLLRADGLIGDTVAVAENERVAARLERVRYDAPLDPSGSHPVAQALRSGEAVVIDDLTDPGWIARVAQSEEHRELIASAGYRSGVVMPLHARGRLLGALSFLYVGEERRYDPEDLPLMGDISTRAATALDNAKLYEERAHVAETLQHSLLPDALPDVPGLALASAYHPALERGEVGGDFYDVFQTPLGWWLVVGDVCGKGADAAAVTALVRHSVRALAFVWESPARVLGAVNEVMLGHRLASRFATAVLVRLEPGGGDPAGASAGLGEPAPARMAVAAAGHPAPVVLDARGRAATVPSQGMLLGIRPGEVTSDSELRLARGTTLVLYTDGLLDAGAPRQDLSAEDLALRLKGVAGEPAGIVRRLEEIALRSGRGRLRDDVAIVVAQLSE